MDENDTYNECLMAMRRARKKALFKSKEMASQESLGRIEQSDFSREDSLTSSKASRGSIIGSMVPDEIIIQHSNYAIRRYEIALMFIDVSGFTDLCERYTKAGRGGPSRLTQVLNAYIGAMVQEILSYGGDVLNFSGDAFLSMWKKSPLQPLQSVVHSAIDCGLSVQKNCGTYHTDVGVVLKVKVAISAGNSHFSLIGDSAHSHYVIVGQPVWDVKIAENLATAGDVITAASAWMFVNEDKYIAEPLGDGSHVKVLKTGVTWKSISYTHYLDKEPFMPSLDPTGDFASSYREFSLRPVIVSALRHPSSLSKFMVQPVLWAVENDEPMEFLTEIRRVVIVFVNIITNTLIDELLVDIVNTAYKTVYSISSESDGLLNKVSMFDKDLMFLLIFGLRGIAHEDDALKGLLCAQKLKENLVHPNIITVSIGITSGTTYCGVVGHVLRREYTVIGSAVNKAARLMMAYPDKVTCDKETFLRSRMVHKFFRLMEFKAMKGIKKPGPVYEFNINGWPGWQIGQRRPLLGRDEELKTFIQALQKAIKYQQQTSTSAEDHNVLIEDQVYGVVFVGSTTVGIGKMRLMDECIHLTPDCVQVLRITLSETNQEPYGLFRQIVLKTLGVSTDQGELQNKIENSLNISTASPVQLYAINVMFDCRFALPEEFEFSGDIHGELSVKIILHEIFKNNIPSLCMVAIEEAVYTDDESWRILPILLDSKTIFVILSVDDDIIISDVARECLSSNILLKMPLSGLEQRYLSALTCQFLDVEAIPMDLEKIIESASNGMPGWILNFIISLVQQGDLTVETKTRTKALQNGAVLPPPHLLYRNVDTTLELDSQHSLDTYFDKVLRSLNVDNNEKYRQMTEQPDDFVQIAVLADTYEVFHVKTMSVNAIVSKKYDSLAPFEKMLLKCGSVLGVVFSRHMMKYILHCNSSRKVAEAVAKLFSIEVLECEGGDFTRKTSKVLIHSSPELKGATPPYCFCLGVKRPLDLADLPKYAFCGYMRFKQPLFQATIYELLTESRKVEMHARALFYLEFYTRRCFYCGSSCFSRFLGKRSNDGVKNESSELKQTQQTIRDWAAEAKQDKSTPENNSRTNSLVDEIESSALSLRYRSDKSITLAGIRSKIEPSSAGLESISDVRSFSSLDVHNCECLAVVLFVYGQIINHCRGAGEHEKLFEAYLEYADYCVIDLNTPLALHLLNEAEGFVSNDSYWSKPNSKTSWLKEFNLGRILSLRGHCMLEIGEHIEARKHLYRALELFYDPFPTTKCGRMIRKIKASFRQWMTLKITLRASVDKASDLVFYEDVAVTLNRLYKLFTQCKEHSNAELAAMWSLNYARRDNANFKLLCESYGNMISIHREKHQFSKCVELEKLAMEVCHRKEGVVEAAELRAVCVLYTNLFFFYIEYCKKDESLAFGLPVMQMVSNRIDPGTRARLVIWVLNLLLSDLRIDDIVQLMREPLYLYDHDQYDFSLTAWYHCYSMVVLIESGYSVESYHKCERFYLDNGDTILQSKSEQTAWYYFACMWLITVRVGAWERSVLWEEKIKELMFKKHMERELYLRLLMLEGLLITLVREINSRNANEVVVLRKTIKNMFQSLRKYCQMAPNYLPRYFLLLAYFSYIRGEKVRAYSYLEKTSDLARGFDGAMVIWAEHTRQHWSGTLAAESEDHWVIHVEPDNLLCYKAFTDRKQIIPYTLPLPKADG